MNRTTIAAPLASRTPATLAARPHPTVHRFTIGESGILANGYLVEGPTGVVAVDSALTVSGARGLRAQLDATGKPLLAVLLTHGHPDHYNGVGALVDGRGDVPILATAAVAQVIAESDAAKEAQWRPVFGDEWPARRVFPNRVVRDGETVTFDGIAYTVHDLGPGESHADSLWIMESDARDAFVGDEAFDGMHSYLSDGHGAAWLRNLDRLERELAGVRTVYPGHGAPGGLELLGRERAYLVAYREELREIAPAGAATLTPEQKKALAAAMQARYPDAKVTFLIELGADPTAADLAASGR